MKLAAIILMLLMSGGLPAEEFAAHGGPQTDWYSRGIVRQQTIKGMTARQKRKQYQMRKRRKPPATTHRRKH